MSSLSRALLVAVVGAGTLGQAGPDVVPNGLIVPGATGIAINGASVSTTEPAVVGRSAGYYGGLFWNITDLGSDVANANAIGLVGQSVYSNAFYAQQGAANGMGTPLLRRNVYPAAYVTRVGDRGAFDYTAPLLTVEDTTDASGDLAAFIRQGIPRWRLDHDGHAQMSLGTDAAPALAFLADPSTGFFRVAMGQVGLSSSGNKRHEWGADYWALYHDHATIYFGSHAETILQHTGPHELSLGALDRFKVPSQKATTGLRYACIDGDGTIVSSVTPCVGT